jgi:hypothetical protein
METNRWNEDTDSDYENSEYIQNEVPPSSINQEFIDNILEVKHKLYDNIVLSPELGTSKAQSNEVLQEYLNKLNDMYVIAVNAQNGAVSITEIQLNKFPPEARDAIKNTLRWIADYFSKNQIPDTIPYSDFIRKSFHEYQFVQDNSFDNE